MILKEAIEIYRETGNHFFDKETMEFFGSRIESELYENRCFITSEDNFDRSKRYYNVRQFSEDFKNVESLGDFNVMKTKAEAEDFINKIEGDKDMKMNIRMKEESIVEFYNAVAEAMGISKDQVGKGGYNPSKLEVSQERFDVLKGEMDNVSFGMMWVCYGPHAVDFLKNDEVIVHEGFITLKEDKE